MKKTNIKLMVDGPYGKLEPYYRVKLDKSGFPYIIIDNEKLIINSVEFPREVSVNYGLSNHMLDIVCGLDELKTILSNPELTSDKLSFRQCFRTIAKKVE